MVCQPESGLESNTIIVEGFKAVGTCIVNDFGRRLFPLSKWCHNVNGGLKIDRVLTTTLGDN